MYLLQEVTLCGDDVFRWMGLPSSESRRVSVCLFYRSYIGLFSMSKDLLA